MPNASKCPAAWSSACIGNARYGGNFVASSSPCVARTYSAYASASCTLNPPSVCTSESNCKKWEAQFFSRMHAPRTLLTSFHGPPGENAAIDACTIPGRIDAHASGLNPRAVRPPGRYDCRNTSAPSLTRARSFAASEGTLRSNCVVRLPRDVSMSRSGREGRFGDVTWRTSAPCADRHTRSENENHAIGERITCECASTYRPREYAG